MMNDNLPLPPYGKIMRAFQDERIFPGKDIYYPSWGIYVGKNAQYFAKSNLENNNGISSYLPYGKDFKEYDWPIHNQNIEIINTGFTTVNFIKKMAMYLFITYKPKS